MNSFILRFSITLILLYLYSCASVNPTNNQLALASWVDVYYVDVIYQLGDPQYVYSDGLSGKVLVYENVLKAPDISQFGLYNDAFLNDSYDIVWIHSTDRTVSSRVSQVADLLYVDKDGFVYSIQSNKSSRSVRENSENNAIVIGVVTTVLFIFALILID